MIWKVHRYERLWKIWFSHVFTDFQFSKNSIWIHVCFFFLCVGPLVWTLAGMTWWVWKDMTGTLYIGMKDLIFRLKRILDGSMCVFFSPCLGQLVWTLAGDPDHSEWHLQGLSCEGDFRPERGAHAGSDGCCWQQAKNFGRRGDRVHSSGSKPAHFGESGWWKWALPTPSLALQQGGQVDEGEGGQLGHQHWRGDAMQRDQKHLGPGDQAQRSDENPGLQ